MELSEYQKAALETDLTDKTSPQGLVIAVLGLVAEASSIANVVKKYLRDGLSYSSQKDFVRVELSDVLWYLSNIASRLGISLEDIARENLDRTRDRHGTHRGPSLPRDIERLDAGYDEFERFPDRIVFSFRETREEGAPRVQMAITHADPNPFPRGAITDSPTGKKIGFSIGDPLRDNAHEEDGYRYHDAIHIGFMAILGWSPVLRDLLRLKRKSRPEIDDAEDGARACDTEEGIVSWLAQRAERFSGFLEPRYVDNATLDYILEHASGLEVTRLPTWLWKHALAAGFKAFKDLSENAGGYIIADLKDRTLTYSKLPPSFDSVPHGGTVTGRSLEQR